MDLLADFKDFIGKEKLFLPGDRLLLAVSGGLDSIVLCELCDRAGLDFTIAHCNFQLRGDESERDQQFVEALAVKYGKAVLVRRFDTLAYVAEYKQSVQVAARELRYGWFREVLEGWEGSSFVVTAHHLDDNIETLVMNFFKGTGIAGLRAMLPRQGVVVRPLLFATRAGLHEFALELGLAWVEDSSNDSDNYTRNYFRHHVIPAVQQVYPSALDNLAANISRFREIESIYCRYIGQQKKKLLEYKGNEVHIPVLKLKAMDPLPTLVYEIIGPFGFSPRQVEAVTGLLDSPSGKYVQSSTHRILKNRNWLIISPLRTETAANILVEDGMAEIIYEQGTLHIQRLPLPEGLRERLDSGGTGAHADSNLIAWIDAAHIGFPLLLRKWQRGDYFYPLGMRKKKKLARLFIDKKLSLADKEKVWIVEMNKKIVWVIGFRIDDRFRISPGTREVLKLEVRMTQLV